MTATIEGHELEQLLMHHKDMKLRLQERILSNPFNRDRDDVVDILRKSVPFLANVSTATLRYIYMRAK